jgi:3-oxoadipyl-CoA thiolase
MTAEAFIIDGVRSAVGNIGGQLSEVRPDDLAAHVIAALVARHPKLDPMHITDVILGCATQAGEDNRNVARMAALLAGLPVDVPGETVNRLCASGMSAVVNASRAVRLGDGDIYVAGGVESMTRAPYVLSKASKPFARDVELFDTSLGWRFVNPVLRERYGTDSMGQTAENVAERYGVSRDGQDAFAARSQHKAAAARESGRFAEEITPIDIPPRKGPTVRVDRDEFIRPDTTTEVLAKLAPVFKKGGSVTAGNSSPLNDGAAALLVVSERGARELGGAPMTRVAATAVAGVEPRCMGIGPVPASRQALERAGITMDDVGVIELNEAFAAQALASLRELGVADDDRRGNPNGGAIALGHPLGMSGARLLLTASRELQRTGARWALATMCVGVGQGMATVLERV